MTVFDSAYAGSYDNLYLEKDYVKECDILQKFIPPSPRAGAIQVLDVGCGTGGHAFELARRDYTVVGIDASKAMVDLAKLKFPDHLGKGIAPKFFVGNAKDFTAPSKDFDAAIMMFAVLGYLSTNDEIIQALKNIGKHLKAGACLVGDIWWGPAVLTQRPGERVRVVSQGEGKLVRATHTTLDTVNSIARVQFDLLSFSKNSGFAESKEVHKMRYFFGPEMGLLFATAGFRLVSLGQFPQIEENPSESNWNAIFVAKKV